MNSLEQKEPDAVNSTDRIAIVKRVGGLSVSRIGQVWGPRGLRKPSIHPKGYYNVQVRIDGKQTMYTVHRLVAEAFIPNPDNLPQVNHKNGNPLDNRVENLEWATQADNVLNRCRRGSYARVLTERKIKDIRSSLDKHVVLAKKYSVHPTTISRIRARERWGWVK